MGRKILCEACNTIFDEDVLKQRHSENKCLVCGASLGGDDADSEDIQNEPEEELVTWCYFEFKDDSTTYFIQEYSTVKWDNVTKASSNIELKYTFQAPPKDANGKLDAAKEVLRREYKPDAFMENSSSESVVKPDALWIAEGKCPRCHSSNIQIVPKKYSIWTGFRTNAVQRVCAQCLYKF